MSASQPVIVSGTTDTGMRYAQLWDDEFKVLPSLPAAPYCMAWMRTGDSQMFGLSSSCPTPWIDVALRMFETFRRGDSPTPTHTVEWEFGRPVFTPVAPERADSAVLFDMEGVDQ